MFSRLAFVISVVACGGSAPKSASPPSTQAPVPAPQQPAPAAPAPVAAAPVARAPAPPPEPPPAPPVEKKPIYERLRDSDGKVAGLAGFSIKRKADKTHCGGFAIVTTRGKKVAKDDEPLADVYKLEFPKGLSFDPDPKNAKKKEASQAKFDKFLQDLTKVGGDARKHYESKLGGDGEMSAKVAAAARIAQIMTRLASVLGRAEIPADVRKGELADDKIKVFCDRMLEVAEPIQAQAELAIAVCADKAKGVDAGWWNEVCVAP